MGVARRQYDLLRRLEILKPLTFPPSLGQALVFSTFCGKSGGYAESYDRPPTLSYVSAMNPDERHRHDRFLRLFIEHQASLHGFVRSLTTSRDEARDVMQEVAAVLWRKFDELASEEDFRRWAFGVARFEALAAGRDRERDRHRFGEELLERLADEAGDVVELLATEREALARCLKKLPEKQRQLIAAAYQRDVRVSELAERLGRTAMSLYKALHRIRETLAECVRREVLTEGRS